MTLRAVRWIATWAFALLPCIALLASCDDKFPPWCGFVDSPPIAAGAIADVDFEVQEAGGEDCSPSFVSLFSNEVIADPSLFVIEPADYVGRGQAARLRLRALAPGETTLTVEYHYKLDSSSQATFPLRAVAADRAEIDTVSLGGAACAPPVLVQAGAVLSGYVHVWAGEETLAGHFYAPFDAPGLTSLLEVPSTDELAMMPPRVGLAEAAWLAPDLPETGAITSTLANSTWSLPWEAFDAVRVDDLALDIESDVGNQTAVPYSLTPLIGGRVPCVFERELVSLTTTTPGICTVGSAFVTRNAAGACQLEARVVGTAVTRTATVTFR